MDANQMKQLMLMTMKDFRRAADDLCAPVSPDVPMPRPRFFVLLESKNARVVWPVTSRYAVYWTQVGWIDPSGAMAQRSYYIDEFDLSTKLLEACKYQPVRVLRVLSRIRAAAAWCRARRDGRRRAAREILRQQSRAVRRLEAALAIEELRL